MVRAMRSLGAGFFSGCIVISCLASCTQPRVIPPDDDGGGQGTGGERVGSGGAGSGGTHAGSGGVGGTAGRIVDAGSDSGAAGSVGIGGAIGTGGAGGRYVDAGPSVDTTPPAPAMLAIDATTHDYGAVEVSGTPADATFTISNMGALVSGSLTVTLTGQASGFTLKSDTCTPALTLAGGANCRVVVTLVAGASGQLNGQISVSAQPGGSVMATLTANARTPGALQIAPKTQDFGAAVSNRGSTTQVFTVSNQGQLTTGALGVMLSGTDASQFQLAVDGCSGKTLTAPTTCQVTVRFAPTSSGVKAASLTASANPGASAVAQLSGTGQRPATLTANTPTINLGTIEAGVTTATSVRITNNGEVPLDRVPTVTSSAPAELIISTNGCTTALAAGAFCDIALGFQPAAGESRSQTLSVSDGTASVTVTVSAIGARRLTVTTTGTGTVTSTPAGIQCGTTCSFLAGQDGTMVTLHASTANGSGAIFAGWSGGGCAGLARDCTVTLLASTTVTASFTPVTANLIFYTSATFLPNLGSAAAYDAACNTAATAAGINDAAGGAYTAVTSDAATTVRSRLGTSANGWVRMDGSPFADTQATLFVSTAKIFNPVRFNELGQSAAGNGAFMLTGTNPDGTASTDTCNNWISSSTALRVQGGSSSGGPLDWLAGGALNCSLGSQILCMGHTRNATVSPRVTAGRKVWLHTDTVNVVAGQSVDALCQASRPAGVTTAIALIAHPNVAASSLIDATRTYVRVDGTLVGTGAQLQASGDLESGIWQTGSGQYQTFAPWTGSTSVQTAGTTASTCGDWADPANAGPPVIGNARTAASGSWWVSAFVGCNNGAGLYCIQTAP
jgi:hypothetical protein